MHLFLSILATLSLSSLVSGEIYFPSWVTILRYKHNECVEKRDIIPTEVKLDECHVFLNHFSAYKWIFHASGRPENRQNCILQVYDDHYCTGNVLKTTEWIDEPEKPTPTPRWTEWPTWSDCVNDFKDKGKSIILKCDPPPPGNG